MDWRSCRIVSTGLRVGSLENTNESDSGSHHMPRALVSARLWVGSRSGCARCKVSILSSTFRLFDIQSRRLNPPCLQIVVVSHRFHKISYCCNPWLCVPYLGKGNNTRFSWPLRPALPMFSTGKQCNQEDDVIHHRVDRINRWRCRAP